MEKKLLSQKTHRINDVDDDNSQQSNKRFKTEETDENIEPESENSNESIGNSKQQINQEKLLRSSARRSSKASPVAPTILSEMGLGILDSDESNQSSILSNLRQPNSVLKSIGSENSSEPMSNLMTGSHEICIESDSNMENENHHEAQSPVATNKLVTSAEKTFVGAINAEPFCIHQDFTPAASIPVSRTNFAGIVHASTASASTAAVCMAEGRPIRNTSLKKFNEHESNSAKKHKGRSPLATVSNNANANNIQVHCTNLGDSDVAKRILQNAAADDDNFFIYKRQDPRVYMGEDNFERLSDEMILSVFKWLPKKTLIRCSLVNHRFNRVAQDESLWARLDLAMKSIQSHSLGRILVRGVVVLRMAQCKILEPLFKPIEIPKEFLTKLQYLDLSMACVSTAGLVELFSRCKQLKKLSLENVPINDAVCKELSTNKQMEVLNLAMCDGITTYGVRKLFRSMKRLQALNISWTSLDSDAVWEFSDFINENLLRLNISGCRKTLTDDGLAKIVRRCPNLRELDLSDCTILSSKTIEIVANLQKLEYLSLSRCYNLNVSAYLEINKLKSITFLDIFGVLSDQALSILQNNFQEIGINKFHHSAIARPTVGSRRTSIWGLRTRD